MSTQTVRTSLERRCYRWLLIRVGGQSDPEALAEMLEVFEAQRRLVLGRGWRARLALWWWSLVDTLRARRPVGLTESQRPLPPRRRRRRGGRSMLDGLRSDLTMAWRALRSSPSYCLVAVTVLAVGIGANATIFTVVAALFFADPPHVVAPGDLVRVGRSTNGSGFSSFDYPDYAFYAEHTAAFAGLLAYDPSGFAVSVEVGDRPESRRGWLVSGNYFDVLGVEPELGRFFVAADDVVDAARPVAVISHGLWQSAMGGDPGVIGRSIRLNGHVFNVVGVAPPGFRGISPIETPPDLWVPLTNQPVLQPHDAEFALKRVDGYTWVWLDLVGRLAPGRTQEAAQADMSAMAALLEQDYGDWNEGWGAVVSPALRLGPKAHGGLLRISAVLLAVVALVLLIAAANVAILLLARGASRLRETTLRAALGAERLRIVRQLLLEGLLVAFGGTVAGLLIASWGAGLAARLLPFTFAVDFRPSLGVMASAVALAVLTVALFSLLPALQATRAELSLVLRGGANDPRRARSQAALVMAQVALCVVLVVFSMLFVRSLRQARSLDLGFHTENRMLIGVNLRNHGYAPEAGRRFVERAIDELGALPGVRAASATVMVPFRGHFMGSLVVEGGDSAADSSNAYVNMNTVAAGYFELMGIPLIAGRTFERGDTKSAPPVAVVNETLARRLWPGKDPLGKRLLEEPGDPPLTVVGVVRDATYYELSEGPTDQIYFPLPQLYQPGIHFLVQTGGEPRAAERMIRRRLLELDPGLAIANVETFDEVIGLQLARYRTSATLVSLFGGVALLLALVGLYGVLSFMVACRTREIGIRVALGAGPRRLARSVVARGLLLVTTGLALGLGGALLGTRFLTSLLFGIRPTDPASFVAALGILLLAGLAASAIPARRAVGVDPLVAIRDE